MKIFEEKYFTEKGKILSMWKDDVIRMKGREMILDEPDIVGIFSACDAWWVRDNSNLNNPHAVLTSGKHSDGFINCGEVMKHPNLAEILGWQLTLQVSKQLDLEGCCDWVIGPAYGGIVLAHEVAKNFGALSGFTKKDETGKQIWKRYGIQKNSMVLLVEDVTTTGGTIIAMFEAIWQGNPESVNIVGIGVLVNRSDIPIIDGKPRIEGRPIIALIEPKINTWSAEECPLCKQGSTALWPKTHWAELTGKK